MGIHLKSSGGGGSNYITVGVYGTEPTFTDNGDGTGNINGFEVCLRSSILSPIKKYVISGQNNLSFTDGGAEYIVVNYNSGTPIIQVTSNYALFDNATVVPVYKCWRVGTIIHSLSADAAANSLAEKIDTMISSTNTYNRAGKSGLIISESSRVISVTSAYVYAGTVPISVGAFTSSTDRLTKATVASGVWTYDSSSTTYDNTNYNPITGEVALGNNDYGVRWFYRSIGDVKEVFYVEGLQSYSNYANAEEEAERTDLPPVIKQHCLLIGRAIIRKSESSGTTESAFTITFSGANTIAHNDTSNIQGGTSGEYYHLTSAELAQVQGIGDKLTATVTNSGDKISSLLIGTTTYTMTRNGYGKWSSITDGTKTWTITRTGQKISSIA